MRREGRQLLGKSIVGSRIFEGDDEETESLADETKFDT